MHSQGFLTVESKCCGSVVSRSYMVNQAGSKGNDSNRINIYSIVTKQLKTKHIIE